MEYLDITFKKIGERAARTLIHLFGRVPWHRRLSVRRVERELTISQKRVDCVFKVRDEQHGRWIAHFEEEASPSMVKLKAIAKRAHLLMEKYDMPVDTTIVVPRRARPAWNYDAGLVKGALSTVCTFTPRVVRPWRIPAREILVEDAASALSWVPAFDSSEEEIVEAHRRIAAMRNPDRRNSMQAEFRTLLGLRYGAQDIIRLLGKDAMLIGPETARHSSFVKPLMVEERKRGLEKGLAKGREEGREEGRAAMRDWIQRTLTRRFPKNTFPDLHGIASLEALQNVADLASTGSANKIAAAIRRASNGNHSA